MDVQEVAALALIASNEWCWLRDLRRHTPRAVLMRLDDSGLIEVGGIQDQWLYAQWRGEKIPPTAPQYTVWQWGSPTRQPHQSGTWEAIWNQPPRDGTPDHAVRATDRGRAELSRATDRAPAALAAIAGGLRTQPLRDGSPADQCIICGRMIETAMTVGAFGHSHAADRAAIEERLSYPVIDGKPHPYLSAWAETVAIVRKRNGLPSDPNLERHLENCEIIAVELERQAAELKRRLDEPVLKKPIGPFSVKTAAEALGGGRNGLGKKIANGTIFTIRQHSRGLMFCEEQLRRMYGSKVDKLTSPTSESNERGGREKVSEAMPESNSSGKKSTGGPRGKATSAKQKSAS